ncbi:MAG TPA: hypothetical protein VHV32_10940 [Candidatus Angelobacter sp.]|nr:hypothetical protein [Candidatus Angelobacter sp.]
MKKFALGILLLCGTVTCVLSAQQQVSVDRPAEPNLAFDDDGGKAQIVPVDLSETGPKTFHGGPVLASTQQVSIFLGAGWGDTQVRGREASLLDVTASAGNTQVAELKQHSIKTLRAALKLEDFTDLSQSKVNDLTIQQKLSDLLKNKAIPAPTAGTIFVIFLAPGIQSTLGGLQGGVGYAAYHNFVNLEAGEIHYVVVPFSENADKHSAAATRAFAETALNPNGRGWF